MLGLHRNQFNNTVRAYVQSFLRSDDLTVQSNRVMMRAQASKVITERSNASQHMAFYEMCEALTEKLIDGKLFKSDVDELILSCQE